MVTLFAVPYAGSSAQSVYGRWAEELGNDINLIPLEYAGHGQRMNEPMHDSVADTVTDLMEQIIPIAKTQSYAFYGHSMACNIVYELLKRLHEAGLPCAKGVYLSGRNPPHLPYSTQLHTLPHSQFIEEIQQVGGTPDGFFDIPELVDVFLPILRNDYKISELYRMDGTPHLTQAPLTFFYSHLDAMVSMDRSLQWQTYTHSGFTLKQFHGDHFFIHDHYRSICQHIRNELVPSLVAL